MIAIICTAVMLERKTAVAYTALRDAVLTHPTIAEGLTVLFANEPRPPGAV